MKASKNISWIAVFFAILTVLILVGIVWKGYGLMYVPEQHMDNPDVLLPILIIRKRVGSPDLSCFSCSFIFSIGFVRPQSGSGIA